MVKTIHFIRRISQRGIKSDGSSIALELGCIKDRKTALTFLKSLDKVRKALAHLIDRDGLVVVAKDDSLITAYRVK